MQRFLASTARSIFLFPPMPLPSSLYKLFSYFPFPSSLMRRLFSFSIFHDPPPAVLRAHMLGTRR